MPAKKKKKPASFQKSKKAPKAKRPKGVEIEDESPIETEEEDDDINFHKEVEEVGLKTPADSDDDEF